MTDTDEVFDPKAVERLRDAVDEATRTGATFATARAGDVQQVLRQLDYAKASRLVVAEGSAALRARGDDALAERDEALARVAELEAERALIEGAINSLDCPTWSDVMHAIHVAQDAREANSESEA